VEKEGDRNDHKRREEASTERGEGMTNLEIERLKAQAGPEHDLIVKQFQEKITSLTAKLKIAEEGLKELLEANDSWSREHALTVLERIRK
jgi:DNA relaxase NicK